MSILSIDTAMGQCAAALYDPASGAAVSRCVAQAHGHAELLVPMVQEVMTEAGCAYEDLAAVIATAGPGGFTGVRVGLSAAQGFGLAHDVPVYGVSTLQALALQVADTGVDQDILVVVDSRRAELFAQRFSLDGAAKGDPFLATAEELKNQGAAVIAGDKAQGLSDGSHFREAGIVSVDPVFLAKFFSKQKELFTRDPSPLYLRPADVSQPKVRARILSA